jgi:hypothetical protein
LLTDCIHDFSLLAQLADIFMIPGLQGKAVAIIIIQGNRSVMCEDGGVM